MITGNFQLSTKSFLI